MVDKRVVLLSLLAILVVTILVFAGLPTINITKPNKGDIIRVIDGDTVEIRAKYLPNPLPKRLMLRIIDVDTPEKGARAGCDYEASMSLRAKLFVEQEISNARSATVKLKKWDKYGGRVLGDVIIDGTPLSEKLISNGYAVKYNGGKKINWCAKQQ